MPSVRPLTSTRPEQPDSLVDIPLPTARPSATIIAKATPVPETSGSTSSKKRPLRNRIFLFGNYRALYEERVPTGVKNALQMSDQMQTVSGDAGASVHLNSLFWFGEPDTTMGNMGLAIDFASLGGFTFSSVDLTDLVWADMAFMYKLLSNDSIEIAAGLDGYFRYTDSSNDPRNNYFQAARSYIGAGMRLTTAWRFWDPMTLEFTVAPHYVIQDLANIDLPSELPLNRFDTQLQFLLNWDIWNFGDSDLTLTMGYNGLMLFDLGSEASQMMHGAVFGLGYQF